MPSLIQRSKACYQYMKATLPETLARVRFPYSEVDAIQQAKASLEGRIDRTVGRLNFIMAVPIVNWETALIEQAKAHGECHHISFEPKGFFDTVLQWQQYRYDNLERLVAGFEAAYRKDHINVLFLYLSEFHIDPLALEQFRRRNVVLVHFNWDDRLHYSSQHKGQSVGVKKIAIEADLCLTMAVGPLNRYVSDGSSVIYWRGGDVLAPVVESLPIVEFDRVLFFGSRYGFRETLIEYLRKRNLPLDVYGAGWGTEFITYESLAYKIPRYALNLGVSTIGYTRNLTCVKGRDIEVPSAGGLYLTNRSSEIEQVYVSGEEVLTYGSLDECYRRACDVLNNPSAFEQVRRNGVRKARAFSWEARFNYLVDILLKITKP